MRTAAIIRKVFLLMSIFLFFWLNDIIAADNSIGIVIATQGKVYAEDTKGTKRLLQRASGIFLHEIISTQDNSSVQLRLNDNSVLSLKPNTKYSVKEFNLNKKDPKNSNYVGGLVSGVLISLSGDISNHLLQTPVASIAIRGTLFESGFSSKSSKSKTIGFGWANVPRGKLHLNVGNQKGDISSADPKSDSSVYKAFGKLDSGGAFQPNFSMPISLNIMSEKDMREEIDAFEAMSEEDIDNSEEEENDVDMNEVDENAEGMPSEELDIENDNEDDDSVEEIVDKIEEEAEE